ncbi:MAG: alpha/beta fold hydrolase, partial [Pseudomonadota bacterium]
MTISTDVSSQNTELDSFGDLLKRAQTHWDTTAVEGELTGTLGIKLRYASLILPDPRAWVVIAPGRSESYLKYQDTAFQLNQAGYNVVLYDHRGQGLSGRMLSDSRKGHVESFAYYVDDLKIVHRELIVGKTHQPVYLLAHSMGGTVGALYAQNYPHDFTGMVLASPMLGLRAGSAGRWLVSAVAAIERALTNWLGNEPAYVPGVGQYTGSPFESNGITHSRARYKHIGTLIRQHPQIALGDPTTHWVDQAYYAMANIMQDAAKIEIQMLLL